jgi:hypothetical protein
MAANFQRSSENSYSSLNISDSTLARFKVLWNNDPPIMQQNADAATINLS